MTLIKPSFANSGMVSRTYASNNFAIPCGRPTLFVFIITQVLVFFLLRDVAMPRKLKSISFRYLP